MSTLGYGLGGGGTSPGFSYKQAARVASTANVDIANLNNGDTIDGVVVATGDRVLLKNQTSAEDNGVYVVGANPGETIRAADFDETGEITASVVIPVEEGTANADTGWLLSTSNPIVVGTTLLTFINVFAELTPEKLETADRELAVLATTTDEDAATASGISYTPVADGMVFVLVNGQKVSVGDGAKNKDCYFSSDGGTTAKAIIDIAAGDILYWMGSVAGYQLAVTDKLSYVYTRS